MNKIKKSLVAMTILAGTCAAPVAALHSFGQEMVDESGNAVSQDASKSKDSGGFYQIVFGSGVVGMLLWFALFGDGMLAIYFSVDCMIMIKPEKLMPKRLIDKVQEAMSQGDVVAAMEACLREGWHNPSSVYKPAVEVFKALGLLKFSNKHAAADIYKLLKSAISNWEQKNEKKAESGELYIKTITVDAAPMLKRLRPAPQGRGYRIRKRSNHITLAVDTINKEEKDA